MHSLEIKNKINDLIKRVLNKDISVWIKDQEIENRIGWIDLNIEQVIKSIENKLKDYKHFDNYILLGMGGSSLSALAYSKILPNDNKLIVIDTVNPDYIYKIEEFIYNKSNLFIVSSKSGTTIETDTLFRYFFKKHFNSNNFIFITDKNTPLDLEIRTNYKDLVVINPNENIGGRYSAFTEFGLVPAYLIDINLKDIPYIINQTKQNINDLVDYELFNILLSKVDTNYFEIVFYYNSENKKYIGYWLEQLIAESTGKNNKGVLPIIYPTKYTYNTNEYTLKEYNLEKIDNIFSYMYLWFIQTVLIASLIGVNPFNQPDVKLSKDTTNEILKNKMNYNLKDYYLKLEDFDTIKNKIFDFIKQNINKDITYISIQFYGDYKGVDNLEELRKELIEEFRVSVVLNLGPRYLHSIGQLYKGGPKKGLFIQILNYPQKQVSLHINDLFVYQALGDLITTKKLNLPILGILI
jgi:glucose-6-phosphate isomerase